MQILVTGAAGFIGYHLSKTLLERGDTVIGLDNMNDYYDPSLKEARLQQLKAYPHFEFHQFGLEDRSAVKQLFSRFSFDRVVNLAAQAGVRYSIENPQAYIDSNLVGFGNILEACRHQELPHLVFASSSSVYGANTETPFSEHQNVDHPLSLYAATKKANELMAHTYAHLYQLACTGLRFFTVYGPWGRPDMALFKFTKNILNNQPIDIYNHGHMVRDFTYVDDIIEGVVRTLDQVAEPNPNWSGNNPDPATSLAPYRMYNIGNNQPVALMDFITALEKSIGKEAIKRYLPMQPGDVPMTYADTELLAEAVGFKPHTPVQEGIDRFVKWYREYY